MQPQRLMVPLFQRPYVWNEESQWEPLWADVTRVADRLISRPQERAQPHFVGAVVLQQLQRPTGMMPERTIIDGQQRLTTIQLLLDALHAELLSVGAMPPAMRIEPLVTNSEHFCLRPEDRFKVWPTNRDRPAFNAVMGATPPIDYDKMGHRGERMVAAHRFFSEQAREWLKKGPEDLAVRAAAIETTVRDLLQMVVIDLGPDENAQEIFETLNARGAPLTAADLIKNFVFQRLSEAGEDVEQAYQRNWSEFETGFWEAEISVGRTRYARSAIFLNHWLVARTGDEVVAREVFTRFKTYANFEAAVAMSAVIERVQRAAAVYRAFITSASTLAGPVDRLGLFGYRTGVLESEVIKPLVLYLLDQDEEPIPQDQLQKALEVTESWMVRRMLVRATTKSYTQVVAELITELRRSGRLMAGDVLEHHFQAQTSVSRYWPDDDEVRGEVRSLLAYRRLGRGRLRMLLEAIEDHRRGWRAGKVGLGGERVARGAYAIEHVMPRKWSSHWPPGEGFRGEDDRERVIHTLGNLTLLTSGLNSKASNAAWLGPGSKRDLLKAHDVLLLNRELLDTAKETWTDDMIRARTDRLVDIVLEVWPVPDGHRVTVAHEKVVYRRKVQLVDLISAGWLEPGIPLFPRMKKFASRVATLLPDGRIEVDGTAYSRPADAAAAIVGKRKSGIWFFLVSQEPKRSLATVKREYLAAMAVDADEEDDDADDAEEDES